MLTDETFASATLSVNKHMLVSEDVEAKANEKVDQHCSQEDHSN
jgi:hypothetical protein